MPYVTIKFPVDKAAKASSVLGYLGNCTVVDGVMYVRVAEYHLPALRAKKVI